MNVSGGDGHVSGQQSPLFYPTQPFEPLSSPIPETDSHGPSGFGTEQIEYVPSTLPFSSAEHPSESTTPKLLPVDANVVSNKASTVCVHSSLPGTNMLTSHSTNQIEHITSTLPACSTEQQDGAYTVESTTDDGGSPHRTYGLPGHDTNGSHHVPSISPVSSTEPQDAAAPSNHGAGETHRDTTDVYQSLGHGTHKLTSHGTDQIEQVPDTLPVSSGHLRDEGVTLKSATDGAHKGTTDDHESPGGTRPTTSHGTEDMAVNDCVLDSVPDTVVQSNMEIDVSCIEDLGGLPIKINIRLNDGVLETAPNIGVESCVPPTGAGLMPERPVDTVGTTLSFTSPIAVETQGSSLSHTLTLTPSGPSQATISAPPQGFDLATEYAPMVAGEDVSKVGDRINNETEPRDNKAQSVAVVSASESCHAQAALRQLQVGKDIVGEELHVSVVGTGLSNVREQQHDKPQSATVVSPPRSRHAESSLRHLQVGAGIVGGEEQLDKSRCLSDVAGSASHVAKTSLFVGQISEGSKPGVTLSAGQACRNLPEVLEDVPDNSKDRTTIAESAGCTSIGLCTSAVARDVTGHVMTHEDAANSRTKHSSTGERGSYLISRHDSAAEAQTYTVVEAARAASAHILTEAFREGAANGDIKSSTAMAVPIEGHSCRAATVPVHMESSRATSTSIGVEACRAAATSMQIGSSREAAIPMPVEASLTAAINMQTESSRSAAIPVQMESSRSATIHLLMGPSGACMAAVRTEALKAAATHMQTQSLTSAAIPIQMESSRSAAMHMQIEPSRASAAPMQTKASRAATTPMHTKSLEAPALPMQTEASKAAITLMQTETSRAAITPMQKESPGAAALSMQMDSSRVATISVQVESFGTTATPMLLECAKAAMEPILAESSRDPAAPLLVQASRIGGLPMEVEASKTCTTPVAMEASKRCAIPAEMEASTAAALEISLGCMNADVASKPGQLELSKDPPRVDIGSAAEGLCAFSESGEEFESLGGTMAELADEMDAIHRGLLEGDPPRGLVSVVMTEDLKVVAAAAGLRITPKVQSDPEMAKMIGRWELKLLGARQACQILGWRCCLDAFSQESGEEVATEGEQLDTLEDVRDEDIEAYLVPSAMDATAPGRNQVTHPLSPAPTPANAPGTSNFKTSTNAPDSPDVIQKVSTAMSTPQSRKTVEEQNQKMAAQVQTGFNLEQKEAGHIAPPCTHLITPTHQISSNVQVQGLLPPQGPADLLQASMCLAQNHHPQTSRSSPLVSIPPSRQTPAIAVQCIKPPNQVPAPCELSLRTNALVPSCDHESVETVKKLHLGIADLGERAPNKSTGALMATSPLLPLHGTTKQTSHNVTGVINVGSSSSPPHELSPGSVQLPYIVKHGSAGHGNVGSNSTREITPSAPSAAITAAKRSSAGIALIGSSSSPSQETNLAAPSAAVTPVEKSSTGIVHVGSSASPTPDINQGSPVAVLIPPKHSGAGVVLVGSSSTPTQEFSLGGMLTSSSTRLHTGIMPAASNLPACSPLTLRPRDISWSEQPTPPGISDPTRQTRFQVPMELDSQKVIAATSTTAADRHIEGSLQNREGPTNTATDRHIGLSLQSPMGAANTNAPSPGPQKLRPQNPVSIAPTNDHLGGTAILNSSHGLSAAVISDRFKGLIELDSQNPVAVLSRSHVLMGPMPSAGAGHFVDDSLHAYSDSGFAQLHTQPPLELQLSLEDDPEIGVAVAVPSDLDLVMETGQGEGSKHKSVVLDQSGPASSNQNPVVQSIAVPCERLVKEAVDCGHHTSPTFISHTNIATPIQPTGQHIKLAQLNASDQTPDQTRSLSPTFSPSPPVNTSNPSLLLETPPSHTTSLSSLDLNCCCVPATLASPSRNSNDAVCVPDTQDLPQSSTGPLRLATTPLEHPHAQMACVPGTQNLPQSLRGPSCLATASLEHLHAQVEAMSREHAHSRRSSCSHTGHGTQDICIDDLQFTRDEMADLEHCCQAEILASHHDACVHTGNMRGPAGHTSSIAATSQSKHAPTALRKDQPDHVFTAPMISDSHASRMDGRLVLSLSTQVDTQMDPEALPSALARAATSHTASLSGLVLNPAQAVLKGVSRPSVPEPSIRPSSTLSDKQFQLTSVGDGQRNIGNLLADQVAQIVPGRGLNPPVSQSAKLLSKDDGQRDWCNLLAGQVKVNTRSEMDFATSHLSGSVQIEPGHKLRHHDQRDLKCVSLGQAVVRTRKGACIATSPPLRNIPVKRRSARERRREALAEAARAMTRTAAKASAMKLRSGCAVRGSPLEPAPGVRGGAPRANPLEGGPIVQSGASRGDPQEQVSTVQSVLSRGTPLQQVSAIQGGVSRANPVEPVSSVQSGVCQVHPNHPVSDAHNDTHTGCEVLGTVAGPKDRQHPAGLDTSIDQVYATAQIAVQINKRISPLSPELFGGKKLEISPGTGHGSLRFSDASIPHLDKGAVDPQAKNYHPHISAQENKKHTETSIDPYEPPVSRSGSDQGGSVPVAPLSLDVVGDGHQSGLRVLLSRSLMKSSAGAQAATVDGRRRDGHAAADEAAYLAIRSASALTMGMPLQPQSYQLQQQWHQTRAQQHQQQYQQQQQQQRDLQTLSAEPGVHKRRRPVQRIPDSSEDDEVDAGPRTGAKASRRLSAVTGNGSFAAMHLRTPGKRRRPTRYSSPSDGEISSSGTSDDSIDAPSSNTGVEETAQPRKRLRSMSTLVACPSTAVAPAAPASTPHREAEQGRVVHGPTSGAQPLRRFSRRYLAARTDPHSDPVPVTPAANEAVEDTDRAGQPPATTAVKVGRKVDQIGSSPVRSRSGSAMPSGRVSRMENPYGDLLWRAQRGGAGAFSGLSFVLTGFQDSKRRSHIAALISKHAGIILSDSPLVNIASPSDRKRTVNGPSSPTRNTGQSNQQAGRRKDAEPRGILRKTGRRIDNTKKSERQAERPTDIELNEKTRRRSGRSRSPELTMALRQPSKQAKCGKNSSPFCTPERPKQRSSSRRASSPCTNMMAARARQEQQAEAGVSGRGRQAVQEISNVFRGSGSSAARCTVPDVVVLADGGRRTAKLLCCLARGVPALAEAWVEESAKRGMMVLPSNDEKRFVVHGPRPELKQAGLLAGVRVHIHGSSALQDHLVPIISFAGGILMDHLSAPTSVPRPPTLTRTAPPVCFEEQLSEAAADLVVMDSRGTESARATGVGSARPVDRESARATGTGSAQTRVVGSEYARAASADRTAAALLRAARRLRVPVVSKEWVVDVIVNGQLPSSFLEKVQHACAKDVGAGTVVAVVTAQEAPGSNDYEEAAYELSLDFQPPLARGKGSKQPVLPIKPRKSSHNAGQQQRTGGDMDVASEVLVREAATSTGGCNVHGGMMAAEAATLVSSEPFSFNMTMSSMHIDPTPPLVLEHEGCHQQRAEQDTDCTQLHVPDEDFIPSSNQDLHCRQDHTHKHQHIATNPSICVQNPSYVSPHAVTRQPASSSKSPSSPLHSTLQVSPAVSPSLHSRQHEAVSIHRTSGKTAGHFPLSAPSHPASPSFHPPATSQPSKHLDAHQTLPLVTPSDHSHHQQAMSTHGTSGQMANLLSHPSSASPSSHHPATSQPSKGPDANHRSRALLPSPCSHHQQAVTDHSDSAEIAPTPPLSHPPHPSVSHPSPIRHSKVSKHKEAHQQTITTRENIRMTAPTPDGSNPPHSFVPHPSPIRHAEHTEGHQQTTTTREINRMTAPTSHASHPPPSLARQPSPARHSKHHKTHHSPPAASPSCRSHWADETCPPSPTSAADARSPTSAPSATHACAGGVTHGPNNSVPWLGSPSPYPQRLTSQGMWQGPGASPSPGPYRQHPTPEVTWLGPGVSPPPGTAPAAAMHRTYYSSFCLAGLGAVGLGEVVEMAAMPGEEGRGRLVRLEALWKETPADGSARALGTGRRLYRPMETIFGSAAAGGSEPQLFMSGHMEVGLPLAAVSHRVRVLLPGSSLPETSAHDTSPAAYGPSPTYVCRFFYDHINMTLGLPLPLP